MLHTITMAMAIIARSQSVLQLFIADGASMRPMAIIIGPVTTGGKNFITFFAPNNLTNAATTTYTSPAINTPPQAYGNALTPSPKSIALTAAYPPRNAKEEPKNAGTFPFVIK